MGASRSLPVIAAALIAGTPCFADAQYFRICETALKLHGEPPTALKSFGEPKYSGNDRNMLVRQVPGTHLLYTWLFRQKIGTRFGEEATAEIKAAVGDESHKIEAISIKISCPASVPSYDSQRPSIASLAKALKLKSTPTLYYQSDNVMAKYGSGDKTVVICANSTFGPPVQSMSTTDFASGKKTTTEHRAKNFSLSSTRVYFAFVGAENEDHWNVFGNSLLQGFRPLPKE